MSGVPAATVSAAALKEKALARYAARRWTCRYSYSAVCGFVTVARLRQIGGQQQKHDPRCRQHQTVRLGKSRLRRRHQRLRHPGG